MNFTVYSGDTHAVLIEPVQSGDKVLFSHCSEGLSAVTPEYFMSHTKPLLRNHGIQSIFQFFDAAGKLLSTYKPPESLEE